MKVFFLLDCCGSHFVCGTTRRVFGFSFVVTAASRRQVSRIELLIHILEQIEIFSELFCRVTVVVVVVAVVAFSLLVVGFDTDRLEVSLVCFHFLNDMLEFCQDICARRSRVHHDATMWHDDCKGNRNWII